MKVNTICTLIHRTCIVTRPTKYSASHYVLNKLISSDLIALLFKHAAPHTSWSPATLTPYNIDYVARQLKSTSIAVVNPLFSAVVVKCRTYDLVKKYMFFIHLFFCWILSLVFICSRPSCVMDVLNVDFKTPLI